MIFTTVKSLREFEFWSGAVDVANRFTNIELDIIENYLAELEGITLTETEVNDIFWHDSDDLLDMLGIDYDEFWEREK
jgi:hypothetical protein